MTVREKIRKPIHPHASAHKHTHLRSSDHRIDGLAVLEDQVLEQGHLAVRVHIDLAELLTQLDHGEGLAEGLKELQERQEEVSYWPDREIKDRCDF